MRPRASSTSTGTEKRHAGTFVPLEVLECLWGHAASSADPDGNLLQWREGRRRCTERRADHGRRMGQTAATSLARTCAVVAFSQAHTGWPKGCVKKQTGAANRANAFIQRFPVALHTMCIMLIIDRIERQLRAHACPESPNNGRVAVTAACSALAVPTLKATTAALKSLNGAPSAISPVECNTH